MSCDPDSPQDMVNKILMLKNNREILDEMGRNARLLAESEYSRDICCEKLLTRQLNI